MWKTGINTYLNSEYLFEHLTRRRKEEEAYMTIRVGSNEEKEFILSKYPYTAQVMRSGGSLVVAAKGESILGFSWSFRREIPAAVGKTEEYINVIEVFDAEQRCRGIDSRYLKLNRKSAIFKIILGSGKMTNGTINHGRTLCQNKRN